MIISIVAGTLLTVLSVLVLWREKRVQGVAFFFFAILVAAVELFDQLSLVLSQDPMALKRWVVVFESFLPGAFLFFSLTYGRTSKGRAIPTLWLVVLLAAIVFPFLALLQPSSVFFYSPDLQAERVLFLETTGYWFYMGIMVYCILALMQIEATFSTTDGSDRWRMKFEVIGIGSIFAIFIFYFSQGLLYRTINMNLLPVRAGVCTMAALLIGYSRIFRGNGVRIAVSRYVLYRSLTLLTVGGYLLILGLVGEGMKYLGVTFSRDLTVFVGFALGIVMMIVLFSGQLRRKVKVLVNKHFFAHKYDYRTEWLTFTLKLSSCETIGEVYRAVLATYKNTFGLKGSSLYIVDKDRHKALLVADDTMYSDVRELPLTDALRSYLTDRSWVLNPSDREYLPTAEEAAVFQQAGARLIVPLVFREELEGLILFGEQLAVERFTYEDYDLMKTFAKQAILSIMTARLSEELAETREVAAVAKISSFVIHDLKNLASSLSLLLENAKEYLHDPDFQDDMIETIRKSLIKMQNLIQSLRRIPEKEVLHTKPEDLNRLAGETVAEIRRMRPNAAIEYQGASGISVLDAEEVKKVITNLVLNALDATAEQGAVTVETGVNGRNTFIRVSDNGCGMTEDFVNHHLFKPFRTTKNKGLGIGLYQCRQIIEAHNGKIEVKSEEGKGSVFTVFLPVDEKQQVMV